MATAAKVANRRDLVVTWREVRPGDMVLMDEQFVEVLMARSYEDDWQGHKWMRTDLTCRHADGREFGTDKWADRDYAVVRRLALPEHTRMPRRMIGRSLETPMCRCGREWEACERERSAQARWAALRDRLEYRAAAAADAWINDEASWCRSVLQLMDGMEAAEPPAPAQQEER